MARAPRLVKRPAVETDLDAVAWRIAQDRPRSAFRFLEAAKTTFHRLAAKPFMGGRLETENPRYKNLRIITIPGFRNHVVIYRPLDDGAEILRVLDGRRDLLQAMED